MLFGTEMSKVKIVKLHNSYAIMWVYMLIV